MTGGHDRTAADGGLSGGARYRSRLAWTMVLIGAFFVVELTAGWLTGSLALLSDAGHMLTDVVSVGMALAAITVAARGTGRTQHTFGLYRLEILAALANAVLLLGVAGYVLYEAVGRLRDPSVVAGWPTLLVALVALAVNGAAYWLLRQGAKESLNVRGALLEVVFDALNSMGVVVAAVILLTTGWPYADPIVAGGIAVMIVPRAISLGRQALQVLLQAAPEHVPVEEVHDTLSELEGVVDVHDLHVWTLTSTMEVVSAHVMIDADTDSHAVLDRARQVLADRYDVHHATLQVEPDTHEGCEQVSW